ncbi:condensation domain-containing protein [Kitasatospora sp. NPDC059648]|uniref:condensation domain-containing protein n=1 Tax=Kitasatospora sp. NPDC059648 TaxID=3346894 RepID=UPI003685219F
MADGTTGSAVPGAGGERVARAAHGQVLVWLTGRRSRGLLLQHVADTFRIGAAIDEPQLRGALGELADRHTALRTSLRVLDGELRQVVHPRIDLPVEFADLRGPDDGKRTERLAELADRAAAQPLDPGRAPLWRAVAARLGEADWAVVLVAHQLVCDQDSLFLLNAELVELCAASEQGRAPVLPELPLDLADHAERRHADATATAVDAATAVDTATVTATATVTDTTCATGERRQPHGEFRRGRLDGLPPGHGIPLDRPRPPVPAFAAAEVRSGLPPGLQAALRTGADRLDAAPVVLLLAAYAALLHDRSGRTDHAIGVPVSGRNRPETRSLVGALAGTAVLRLDTSGDPAFAELVDRVRSVAPAAREHRAHQEHREHRELPLRRPAEPPLHRLAFALTGGAEPGPPCGFAEDDLLLEVADRAARLVYDSELFAPATARGLLDDYLALLGAALAEPATPLSMLLSLLPGAAGTRPPRPAHDERSAGSPAGARRPSEPDAPRGGRAAPSVLLRSTT